jgi:Carboxypeptidase regulatory-like domain/TonB dependent receptor-like, beta-barrel
MKVLFGFILAALLMAPAVPALAQSTNTATVLVVVLDQTGAVVKDARVTIINAATAASRESDSGGDGTVTFPALSLTGSYTINVTKAGFTADDVIGLTLRSGETATVKVKLVASGGKSVVTVYGTNTGVRADAQIGLTLDSPAIDELPILGRKVTTLPLYNSAFRQGKGTGDLFVNATYFVTAAGSRRTTTYMLDGASNDEGWGRQTAVITVPLGAVQEADVLSNAWSAEYGWTAGPAMNVVTKSGTNTLRGEGLYMARPGGGQPKSFSTDGFCPPSIPTCTTPSSLESISPVDIPDKLNQVSGSIGGALAKDKTFFFGTADFTWQDRTTALSPTLPSFVLDNGSLEYTGEYRQQLAMARVDHKLEPDQTLMFRFNLDRMHDTNPNDTVIGTTAPTAARRYTRRAWSAQANHTMVVSPTLLNEGRIGFTDGDPVTLWEAVESSTTYQRTAGPVPFRIGNSQFSDLYSRQLQISDSASWSRDKHYLRFGGSLSRHWTGGTGNEPGQTILGTFTFVGTGPSASLPFDQLTLNDVQNYSQPFTFGAQKSYTLNQWLGVAFVQDSYRARKDLTLDLGLRYDHQSITTANANFAPRLGFGWHPKGDSQTSIRGGYAMYYTQIRTNSVAGYLMNGLDGFSTYTATPGQPGFPTCLTGSCLPVDFSSNPASAPARNITIVAGKRDFYQQQFAQFGLDFSKLPNYPDTFENPRSQVTSIGAEREVAKGFFVGSDYVHQHWSNLDRTIDLNAPAPFDRTASGQVRTVAAANATRPMGVPVAGGVTQVSTIMNFGVADYDGWQNQISYRGNPKMYAALSYTLSKATNTFEPDGNGIATNQPNIARLGEEERGSSLLDQRHRAVITFSYHFPYNLTAGTVTMLASSRPVNSTTGVDNDGDGNANNDRPVIDGAVIRKSAFRGTGTQDVSIFVEGRLKTSGRTLLLRVETFNLFNHANLLGRGITTYGDTGTALPTFGQFASAPAGTTVAIPAFANIDPPRMVQVQVRYLF